MAISSDLLWYLLFINLVTLGAMLLDKAAAKAHGSRMSELTIFILSLIGGVWGTIAGMLLFPHKTAKTDFQAVIILIVLLNLALLYHLLHRDRSTLLLGSIRLKYIAKLGVKNRGKNGQNN